ncbi:hypothetical protein LTR08_006716 [Meristemomyces frigidus]|nr:hypothetical protein LTR08_006716 [Meristemomyces frigidus]
MQTCTGCRKQKAPEDFWRFNRTNLTCNACSERHRTRKAKVAAQMDLSLGLKEVGSEALYFDEEKEVEDAPVQSGAQFRMMVPTYPVPFGEWTMAQHQCAVQRFAKMGSEDSSVASAASPATESGL